MVEQTRASTASIPKYIREGLPKQDDDTLRAIITHCERLLEAREEAELDIPENAVEVEERDGGVSIVWEKVKCGKDGCKCTKGQLHGPYPYKYWKENGVTKSEYATELANNS